MAGYNLKDEKEVKEYLKNLHTEYQFGCYSEKKAEVCHLLGSYAEAIENDQKRAASIFKSTCDKYNFGKSCMKYGFHAMRGVGCEKNIKEAYNYWAKSCDYNDGKGCFHAATALISLKEFHENGKITQMSKALDMLKKSCYEQNYEKACFNLSGLYLGGLEEYVDKNYKEAYKLSLKCCELGNPYACANVSQMHERGDGVQKNAELAAIFKKRAIELHKELIEQRKQLKFHQGVSM